MNNLLKILISLFVVISLNADQGKLTSITSVGSLVNGGNNILDMSIVGTNIYTVNSNNVYKHDVNSSLITTSLFIGSTIKLSATTNYVYLLKNDNVNSSLEVYNTDLNISQGTFTPNTSKYYNAFALSDDEQYIFIATSTGVSILDISNVASISEVAFLETTNAHDVKVNGDVLYVADDWSGLKVIDITNPISASFGPSKSGTYYKLAIENDYLYALGQAGISSFDISSPSAPLFKSSVNSYNDGTNNVAINIGSDYTNFFVQDMYAYVLGTVKYIFDVSNKSAMVGASLTGPSINEVAVIGDGNSIFISTDIDTFIYNPESDYDDNLTAASSQTEKNTANLSSDEGIFGELKDSSDIDFIKVNLQSGRLAATITGLSDLNVSIYDTNNTSALPIVSVQSNLNSESLEINKEVSSGVHYIRVQSTSGVVGEYKITADFSSDDWPDAKTSASLINLGEKLSGNMLNGDDTDYFRVDFTSKGNLYITSVNEDIIDIEIANSYDTNIIAGVGSLELGRTYDIPSAGIYFIKVKAKSADVTDRDYSFRVDFSKDDALDKEDNANFALKQVDTTTLVSTNYRSMKSAGSYIYVYDDQTLYLMRKNKSDLSDAGSYYTGSNMSDYQIVGDYIYVLTDGKLSVIYKDTMGLRSSLVIQNTSEAVNKVLVNGDYAYISFEPSVNIEVIDISNKDDLSSMDVVNTNYEINDFDLKTSFDSETNTLKTYLYFATNSGIRIHEFKYVEDENGNDILEAQSVQKYKDDTYFQNIKISNPYAYVTGHEGFSILYVKKPTTAPKFKGSIYVDSIQDIVINQDFAYLITHGDYLKVINIKDQTSPILVDVGAFSLESIYVEDGLGFISHYSDITLKNYADIITKYDMAKDYSDVKGSSTKLDLDTKVYGVISEHKPDEVDMFYINASSSQILSFSAIGSINTTYEIFSFTNDVLVHQFNALTSETNSSVELGSGEYYLSVKSTDINASGSYEFIASVLQDDVADNFIQAYEITADTTYDKNITADDLDIVKITISERGDFTYTVDENISAKLYYDDTSSLITTDVNSVISVVLNPGTYYIKMESKNGFSGEYSFNASLVGNGELSMPDGFDGIRNFNAQHILYGPRYMYVIDKNNELSIYNHLLQEVENGPIYGDDFSDYCGRPLYNNNKIYVNYSGVDSSTGQPTCGHGFRVLDIESDGEEFYSMWFPNSINFNYITPDTGSYLYVGDIALVGIDGTQEEEYAYVLSDQNNTIFKTSTASDLYQAIKPYGVFSTTAKVDDIKFIKNDGVIDFIAIGNVLSIYESNPNYLLKATDGTTIDNTPKIIASNSFTLAGNIQDIYLDKDLNKLYLLSSGTNVVSIIDYSSGVGTSTQEDIDLGMDANGMFVKGDSIYLSFESYGVKSYDYPLSSTPTLKLAIQNIGVDVSRPFTYDGTTVNYLSAGNPQVYFLGDTFSDGRTTATYTVIEDVKEGEGGFEGCFIATAAYGNYFQTNVEILRDFRDDYLLKSELGRAFVDFYYRHSPSIASAISTSEFAKATVRVVLTPVVYIIKYPLTFLAILLMLIFGFRLRGHMTSRKVVVS